MKRVFIILLLFFSSACSTLFIKPDKPVSVHYIPERVFKGEMIIFIFENLKENCNYKLEIHSRKIQEYKIIPEYDVTLFYIGISLHSPSNIKLIFRENENIIWEKTIKLKERKIEVSKVSVKQEYVTPSRRYLKRIKEEREMIEKAKSEYIEEQLFEGIPIYPVSGGEITTPYGYKRIYNKQKISYHYGTDIAAPEGTPVKAIFSGKVTLTGNYYYTGNTIFINHGKGIISMYSHLSEIYVKKDDFVDKSEIIGAIGSTGRVTGPHLHLSVYVNKVSIDPMCLYDIFPQLWNEL